MRCAPSPVHAVVLALACAALLGGCTRPETATLPGTETGDEATFSVESPAFSPDDPIPVEHAREGVEGGQNVSIPYTWRDAPVGTKSFALLLMDTHPSARRWVHWMVTDIPADAEELPAGASGAGMPEGALELVNSFGDIGYGGPEPPAGSGGHAYLATIYALDVEHLEIAGDADVGTFRRAVTEHTLADASYTGTFVR